MVSTLAVLISVHLDILSQSWSGKWFC